MVVVNEGNYNQRETRADLQRTMLTSYLKKSKKISKSASISQSSTSDIHIFFVILRHSSSFFSSHLNPSPPPSFPSNSNPTPRNPHHNSSTLTPIVSPPSPPPSNPAHSPPSYFPMTIIITSNSENSISKYRGFKARDRFFFLVWGWGCWSLGLGSIRSCYAEEL